MGFIDRLIHGWNAFTGRDPTPPRDGYGPSYSYRPDRVRFNYGNDRSAISTIQNRIAIDVAQVNIVHARLDTNKRYIGDVDSGLNYCLNTSANTDQTGRVFIQSSVMSMLDEGVVALIPTKGSADPTMTNIYNIEELRPAKILEWYPDFIRVSIYDDTKARHVEKIFPKKMCAIVENPFYQIMNEQNSTAKRLNRKLVMLDALDEQNSSGKLDLIIQLPYVIKNDQRREQAEKRRKDIEMQLSGSKYGIAYTDGTEKITQLNRAVENNLLAQIEYLTRMLYSQLGLPEEVFNGTANEQTMLNYNNRTIVPILTAITDEMNRKFLTKTARTKGHTVTFFLDPFKLVPVTQLADLSDKLTRNEILSSNEIRQIMGFKPSDDPRADELRNKNINTESDASYPNVNEEGYYDEEIPE